MFKLACDFFPTHNNKQYNVKKIAHKRWNNIS